MIGTRRIMDKGRPVVTRPRAEFRALDAPLSSTVRASERAGVRACESPRTRHAPLPQIAAPSAAFPRPMHRRPFLHAALGAAASALAPALPAAAASPRPARDRRTYAEIRPMNDALFADLFAAAEAPRRRWQGIVVHHSAAEYATLEGIDRYHRNHFGDPLGAEYHFVVNNGKKRPPGLVEPARWRYQELAAHLFHPERAPESLAVCLIGNFEERHVPSDMMDGLASLCRALMAELSIPLDRVTTHRAVDGRLTQCPGKHFDLADLHHRIQAT